MATRRERVVLELEDNFTSGMARAAASAALLNRELDSLSKDSIRTRRSVSDIDQPVQNLGRSASQSGSEIDKMSGRMRILADVTAVLGPGLVGIGAVGVPAITGLAAQLGFAATGAATAVLAFQGVGDALKTLNTAALDPTTENLAKAQVALERLSPAAQEFVSHLGALLPELRKLRDVAAEGLFPGLTQGLDAMETALPRVQSLISSVATELGSIAGDTGKSLASERWAPFLDFLAREAPEALGQMADAAGNTAHAVAELWMATDPINDDFGTWLVNATDDLDKWATGLSKTQGFADFMAYLDQTGPKVAEAFGAIANAALQIVQAAAPLSGPVLDGVKALADVISAVANSDIGTPLFTAVAALALFNRALAVTAALQKNTWSGPAMVGLKATRTSVQGLTADLRAYNAVQNTAAGRARATAAQIDAQTAAAGRLRDRVKTVGKGAALLGGLAIASTGAADGLGLTNTASLALMGTLAGPWGAAAGAAIGATIDLTHANDGLEDAIKRVNAAAKAGDFSEMRAGIADLENRIKDMQHTSSVGDFFGDTFSKIGDGLSHPLDFSPGDERVHRTRNAIREAEKTAAALEAANRAKARSELIHDGYGVTARNLDAATQSADSFNKALTRVNEKLTQRSAARDYEAALDDFTKSVKENGKTLDKHTEKGRNNQAALDRIASSTAALASEMNNPVLRAEFLDKARKQFINAAVEAGKSRTEARLLADQLIGLDKLDPKVDIHADTGQAVSAVAALKSLMDSLHDRNIHINVTKSTNATLAEADANHADGGTVLGPRHPYGDKVYAMLAPGEEVITNRNGEADRFRSDRAAGRIPAYADGGRVTRIPAAAMASGPGIDYDRLAASITGSRAMGYRDTRDALLSAMRTALGETPIVRTPANQPLPYGVV